MCVYGGRGIGALIGHLDGALVGGERVVSKLFNCGTENMLQYTSAKRWWFGITIEICIRDKNSFVHRVPSISIHITSL